METELGDLLAEGIRKQLHTDLVMIASGSIRKPSLGPIITLQDFLEAFPYTDQLIGFNLTGAQLRRLLTYMMREEAFADDGHSEWYQFSGDFFCEYDRATEQIVQLTMYGKEVQDDDVYRVAMQGFHFLSMKDNLGISIEEIEENGQPIEIAIKGQNVLKEYLLNHDYIQSDGERRLLIHDP